MTVKEYHQLRDLSASRIKLFLKDRWKFKKWLDGENPTVKNTPSLVIGNLFDFYATRDFSKGNGKENFDDVFSLYNGKPPGGQMGEVVEALYEKTLEYSDDLGKVNKPFSDILRETYDEVLFNEIGEQVKLKTCKTYASFVKKFEADGLDYYSFLRKVEDDVTPCTIKQVETAEAAYNKAITDSNVKGWFLSNSTSQYDIINQFAYRFEFMDEQFKILLDKVFVHHTKKKIVPLDFKTTFDQDEFNWSFLDLKYYIQSALYMTGLHDWRVKMGYDDYEIVPFTFIAVPTNYVQSPLIFPTLPEHYQMFMDGFEVNNRKYTGLVQAIEEIKWHKSTKVWSMTKEDFENKGVRQIKL